METKNLTCINCPMGCQLTVTFEQANGKVNESSVEVTGNNCPRGALYAVSEITNPTRTVTGTVSISNRAGRVVSVKTKTPIPKNMISEVAKCLMDIKVQAPVKIGDVVLCDICKTGSDLVITKNVD